MSKCKGDYFHVDGRCSDCGRHTIWMVEGKKKCVNINCKNCLPTEALSKIFEFSWYNRLLGEMSLLEKNSQQEPPKQTCPYCGVELDRDNVKFSIDDENTFLANCKICGQWLSLVNLNPLFPDNPPIANKLFSAAEEKTGTFNYFSRFKYLFLRGEIKVGEGLE